MHLAVLLSHLRLSRKFRLQYIPHQFIEFDNVSKWKLVRVILHRLVDSFCLNAVDFSNISIQQNFLISDFNDAILQVLKFHNVAHIRLALSWEEGRWFQNNLWKRDLLLTHLEIGSF
jgi:hypothetical protein